VAVDGRLAGLLAVADPLKATSREAVKRLERMGLEVVLLTGDARRTAEAIARQAGIGFTDAQIVEIIAVVAENIFTNLLNIVAGTEIDFPVVRTSEAA